MLAGWPLHRPGLGWADDIRTFIVVSLNVEARLMLPSAANVDICGTRLRNEGLCVFNPCREPCGRWMKEQQKTFEKKNLR